MDDHKIRVRYIYFSGTQILGQQTKPFRMDEDTPRRQAGLQLKLDF